MAFPPFPQGNTLPPRLPLYGRGAETRKAQGCLLGCLAVVSLLLAALATALTIGLWGMGSVGPVLLVVLVPLALAPLVFVAWALIATVRGAAWLEHTTVVVRTGFTTRRCDLAATPDIVVDSVLHQAAAGHSHRKIPVLRLRDSATGRKMTLLLRSPATGRLLEPAKLYALAQAMCAGTRSDPDAQQRIERIAQGLRAMADDPFADAR